MSEDKLSEIAGTLKELLKWTRFTGMKEVKSVLQSTLDSDVKKIVYHLSDGNTGSVRIAAAVKLSDWTIRNYWKSWSKLGIVEAVKMTAGERYRKAFDMEDFGIDIPKATMPVEESKKDERAGEAKA
jgi:hypothetical protein